MWAKGATKKLTERVVQSIVKQQQEVIEHCWDGLSRMLWLEQKHGRKVLRMARKLDKEIGQRFVSLPKDKITAHKRSRQEMKRHIDLELHKLQAQKQFPFSLQG